MNKINILLIEDSPSDATLIQSALEEESAFDFSLKHVDRLDKGMLMLGLEKFDLILTDLSLPDSEGLGTFEKLHGADSRIPVVVLTNRHDMETGLSAIKKGAQDYLPKSQMNGFMLSRVIYYAIERQQMFQQLQDALTEVKTLSGMLPICACCKKIRDDKGYWNQIETYIMRHSTAMFSHGLCPECFVKQLKENGLPVPEKYRDIANPAK